MNKPYSTGMYGTREEESPRQKSSKNSKHTNNETYDSIRLEVMNKTLENVQKELVNKVNIKDIMQIIKNTTDPR